MGQEALEGHIIQMVPPDHPPVLSCRCEEVLDVEVLAAILAGARTVDDIKRRTRAGMGACQGIFCMPTIAATVSQLTGTPISQVAAMTARPPVRPIPLAVLADLFDDDDRTTRDNSETT
jgi:bacterioferritin-associated ferredoxin